MNKYEIQISGMKCAKCSSLIESAVKEKRLTSKFNINLISGKATVSLQNEENLNQLKDLVSELGFSVASVEIIPKEGMRSVYFNSTEPAELNMPGIQQILFDGNEICVEYDPTALSPSDIRRVVLEQTNAEYTNILSRQLNALNSFTPSVSVAEFASSLILTIIIMNLTMLVTLMDNYWLNDLVLGNFSWNFFIVLILSSLVVFWFGYSIYKESLLKYVRFRAMDMFTLISLGSLSAILLSVINTTQTLYDPSVLTMSMHSMAAASTVLTISIVGKYLEEKAKNSIRQYTSNIMSASKINFSVKRVKPRNKKFTKLLAEEEIDVGLIEKGEFIQVNTGDFLLLDCELVAGRVMVDNSFKTGNALEKSEALPGHKLKSGSTVLEGEGYALVKEDLESSTLFRLSAEMQTSLNQKVEFHSWINKVIEAFVPTVIGIAFLTFCFWMTFYLVAERPYLTLDFVFERSISVLVASCPCAFGLAIPTVISISISLAFKNHILVKNMSALTDMNECNALVFDKTGTLTDELTDCDLVIVDNTLSEDELWFVLFELEKDSKHPVGEMIHKTALGKPLDQSRIVIKGVVEEIGGAKAIMTLKEEEHAVVIGNSKYLENNGIPHEKVERSCSFICMGNTVLAQLFFSSNTALRPDAIPTVSRLRHMKKKVYILSGDSQASVTEASNLLRIPEENAIGDATNTSKKVFLQELKHSLKCCMVGDGINDMLSLSEANVGVSFNANSNFNLISSDVVFIKNKLSLVLSLLKLSKVTNTFILFNLFWAFAYNIVAIPLTSGLFFYFLDFTIKPSVSSLAMLGSSLLIVLTSNAMRLISIKPSIDDDKSSEYVLLTV